MDCKVTKHFLGSVIARIGAEEGTSLVLNQISLTCQAHQYYLFSYPLYYNQYRLKSKLVGQNVRVML